MPIRGWSIGRWACRVTNCSCPPFRCSIYRRILPTAQRRRGGDWIADRVLPAFEGRILPVDMAVVRRSAGLGYAQTRDALLVATALVHGLTLVTRHVAAYKIGRPKLFCPWGFVPETVGEDWRQATRGDRPGSATCS
ncbi:hypothetical protein P0F65_11095 [Sphingomonas sp. I4]